MKDREDRLIDEFLKEKNNSKLVEGYLGGDKEADAMVETAESILHKIGLDVADSEFTDSEGNQPDQIEGGARAWGSECVGPEDSDWMCGLTIDIQKTNDNEYDLGVWASFEDYDRDILSPGYTHLPTLEDAYKYVDQIKEEWEAFLDETEDEAYEYYGVEKDNDPHYRGRSLKESYSGALDTESLGHIIKQLKEEVDWLRDTGSSMKAKKLSRIVSELMEYGGLTSKGWEKYLN